MSQIDESGDEPPLRIDPDKPQSPNLEPPQHPESIVAEEAAVEPTFDDEEKPQIDEGDEDDPMEDDAGAGSVSMSPVFCIGLKQPQSDLQHKMSVPELCRNFSAVSWCGKLNAIACASETCARIPSSNANAPFWIPIHIVIPERPTECAVFNVNADSPRDSVQFIEWSPTSCPRALLIANFHGRITIWTQPSQGPANLVRDASSWSLEHEWQQDIAVVTKWLSGVSPYKWLSSKSSSPSNAKSTFEEKFLSQQSQNSDPSYVTLMTVDFGLTESCDVHYGAHGLWPRKRRMSDRDAAFGLNTSLRLGAYLGIMGSRRDVVTAVWKTGLDAVWYKRIRCLRQTSAFASHGATGPPNQNERETWWISRWVIAALYVDEHGFEQYRQLDEDA